MTSATAEMAHAGASGFQSSAPACVTANALPTQGMNRPPSARVPSRAGEAPIGDVAGALDRVSAAVWRAFVAAERGAPPPRQQKGRAARYDPDSTPQASEASTASADRSEDHGQCLLLP